MKTNAAVSAALKNNVAVKALPVVTVDWNMNRYVGAVAENMLTSLEIDNAFDAEFFPIESIVEPNRPTKGINKARVGDATIGDDYQARGQATPNGRFYIADADDTYKYWTSQTPSDASTGALTNCKPQVIYNASTAVNKIVIKLENSWASPKTFNIQTTTSATPNDTTDWTTVATETSTPSGWKGTGVITLYWNGSNWTNGTRSDNADTTPKTTTIRGVRIVVTALEGGYQTTTDGSAVASTYVPVASTTHTAVNTTGKDAYFDLIEISARLEVDLSQYAVDTNDQLDMSDVDDLYPIGTTTSNIATLNLSNLYFDGSNWVPGLFSADNTSSPYYNYIDESAKINCMWHFFNADTGADLGYVQEYTMYTENWNGQNSDTVSVDMTDYSKFLDGVMVRPSMWENLTVPEIVWRLMDSVGFVNYHIDQDADRVTQHTIPVFHTDGESSVWAVLNDLAKASQTAIYFDANGVLQVKTRDFAFSAADAAVWTFTSVQDVNQLANIVSLDQTSEFQPNNFKVMYSKTNWAPENRGQPTLQSVWAPDGNVVLRGTPLVKQLDPGDGYFLMGSDDVRLWPYKGIVNIQGELIRYAGKRYVYYTGSGGTVKNTKDIMTADEFKSRDAETPYAYRHKNYFTGALKIVERGLWNSEEKSHYVDANGYTVSHIVNGSRSTGVAGFNFKRQQSIVTLYNTHAFNNYKDILVVTRGATVDSPFYNYGTKMRFNPSRPDQRGGLIIHSQGGANEDGYYIEFCPKPLSGKERQNRNELIVYSRVNGKDNRIGGKGTPLPLAENFWYEVDVTYRLVGSDHRIQVWVDGKKEFDQTITGANKNPANGKFGMFMRGKSQIDYEYLYAIAKNTYDPADDFSFLDKVARGYTGNQWDREWVYKWRSTTRRVRKKTNKDKHRFNKMFMDEFGPYVHEIREYNVKFDPSPVVQSRLYLTNDWSTCALEYRADPFGAHFLVANTARNNVVISGDDSLSFAGTGGTVNQVFAVYGRALVIADAKSITVTNDDQVRRRGKIDSELDSPWIQTRSMAQDIGDWMNAHWSYGNEAVTIEVFGNPLIEVADVVHVTYPSKHIDADFFVVGVRNSFDNGITTSLDLRRRV